MSSLAPLLLAALVAAPPNAQVADEHKAIGVDAANAKPDQLVHNQHPDAQWFPEATLGLFIHWGLSSVKAINLSWPMMDGRGQTGNQITPNQYWEQAKTFNPKKYDPDKWLKAAKAAGFTYAVFTTRHHEGFAMWSSKFGDFDTKNYMGGRDLVKPFVEACRRNGLKVGLYYSPPDWYFDRDYVNFSRKDGAKVALDADHKPRTNKHTAAEQAQHTAAYAAKVRGQLEELLTQYGKIDLLWFDGKVPGLSGDEVISQEYIRQMQPGIVITPRLHNQGDFKTYERKMNTTEVANGWAEFCNTWTNAWPHVAGAEFRAPGFVLGQLVSARALHINYLISTGPNADGELVPEVYENMAAVGAWMKKNGPTLRAAHPLPKGESATVPATAAGKTRYLFALPAFKENGAYVKDLLPAADSELVLRGVTQPKSVRLRGGAKLEHAFANGALTVRLPAARRSNLVDVVEVGL